MPKANNQIVYFNGDAFKVPKSLLVQTFQKGLTFTVLQQDPKGEHQAENPVTGKIETYKVVDSAQRTHTCGTPFAEGIRRTTACDTESSEILTLFKEHGIKRVRSAAPAPAL